ncbi:hypothetical protein C2G38_2283828 [Gigaspora rosea]|uniref:Uncharacterized protein n=1 Tax=Gigaspora rosea TaxID=44941 RepID=A0A397UBK2_9GLOM|nr:hypothetical protein C2G38_2283828 [Gigaspora rosea]
MINLKFGGNGWNIGRKQNYVMMTVCLLNEGKKVLKPKNQYCICLYIGQEKYDTLMKVGRIFEHELFDFKNNSFLDSDSIQWVVELYFCGDWMFMYIIMGLNAPNTKYFCLYCNCDAEPQWDMDQIWLNTGNSKRPGLRSRDKRMLVTSFTARKGRLNQNECRKLKKSVKEDLALYIQQPGWMAYEKLKQLRTVLRQSQLTDQEIYQYKINAENWIRTFCHPSQGSINSLQKCGLYKKSDVTSYMHIFAKHISLFMQQLKTEGLSLKIFSTSGIEKKNHEQVRLFFGGKGGSKKNSVVYDIMSFKNQHLFYLMNNTPTKITIQNINVNNKNDKENLLN